MNVSVTEIGKAFMKPSKMRLNCSFLVKDENAPKSIVMLSNRVSLFSDMAKKYLENKEYRIEKGKVATLKEYKVSETTKGVVNKVREQEKVFSHYSSSQKVTVECDIDIDVLLELLNYLIKDETAVSYNFDFYLLDSEEEHICGLAIQDAIRKGYKVAESVAFVDKKENVCLESVSVGSKKALDNVYHEDCELSKFGVKGKNNAKNDLVVLKDNIEVKDIYSRVSVNMIFSVS